MVHMLNTTYRAALILKPHMSVQERADYVAGIYGYEVAFSTFTTIGYSALSRPDVEFDIDRQVFRYAIDFTLEMLP